MSTRRVNTDGVGRLPAFSHATVAGATVYLSGVLGTAPGEMTLVEGGGRPGIRPCTIAAPTRMMTAPVGCHHTRSPSNTTPATVDTIGSRYVTVEATAGPASRTMEKLSAYATPVPTTPRTATAPAAPNV